MKRRDFANVLASAAATGAAGIVPEPTLAADTMSVLYAGSLVNVMERVVAPALARHGIVMHGEGKGSVALANLIKGGLRTPDVFISADAKVIEGLMGSQNHNLATWYAVFATTRLVVGYAPSSPLAADFVAAGRGDKRLIDVLLAPGLRLGRTDPALDPKGYRTIIAAKLLEADGGPPAFAVKLLGDDRNAAQIFPEETLLARLETGDLDAAFLYATESTARRLPAIELPKTANLGDPAQAAHYATAAVTIDGVKRTGAPAAYALTIPATVQNASGAAAVVAFLLSDAGTSLLRAAGVTTVRPILSGDRATVPEPLRSVLEH